MPIKIPSISPPPMPAPSLPPPSPYIPTPMKPKKSSTQLLSTDPRWVYTPQPPAIPPVPEWLAPFSPGQITGAELQRLPIRTPSAQMWARTPWSVREGLRGYTEWAGHRPYLDVLGHMAMMLPSAPRGAGRGRWVPVRQRA